MRDRDDAPPFVMQLGLLKSYNATSKRHRLVPVENDRRFSHTWVIGKTGVGKSTALIRWAVDDILAGEGVAFFDPHGDAAEEILSRVPRRRREDVLYFNPSDLSREREEAIEARLAAAMPGVPWSVRNQARMHLRNGDDPYHDTEDAMRYWLETATCVAVRLEADGRVTVIAPYGLDDLLALRSGPTSRGRERYSAYLERMRVKNWPARWPRVRVEGLR